MPLPKRTLPEFILIPEYKERYEKDNDDSEEFGVQRKFCKRSARFGETNIDQVALSYMCPEAALFWLPMYITYVMHIWKKDIGTNHFSLFLYNLQNERFVHELRTLATPDECKMVLRYLDWYEWNLGPVDLDIHEEDIAKARKLWSEPISQPEY